MSGDSQERNLPATEHRLRKEREKGRVASSAEFVSAAVMIVVCVWLTFRAPALALTIGEAFDLATRGLAGTDAATDLSAMDRLARAVLAELGGLFALAAGTGIVANVAHKGGLVVSFEPLKPDLSRIDLVAGFGRMFSFRQSTSFIVALLALAAWTVVVVAAAWRWAPATLNGPVCGLPCVVGAGADALWWLAVLGALAVAVVGLLDLPLQIAFFRRDMRMSHQDRKMEYKETEGSPEMARFQQIERQRILREGSNLPTIVVTSAATAVGLRYHPTAAPIPVVVSKGADAEADRIVAAAKRLGIPIHSEPALSRRLHADVMIGFEIPQAEFGAVAPLIVRFMQL